MSKIIVIAVAFLLQQAICFGGLTYVIYRQQEAIEALVNDQIVSTSLDGKLSGDFQRLRRVVTREHPESASELDR